MAAKTWNGEWWKHGGGGTIWNGITYDAEFNQILSAPATARPGTRRCAAPAAATTCSSARSSRSTRTPANTSGTTRRLPARPGTTTRRMDIVLADSRSTARPCKALMHAPKNGFFYVIDRANGKLLSAGKFAKVTWASAIDMKTGRPIEVTGALRKRRGIDLAEPLRRAQLASDVLQPEDRARLHPENRAVLRFNDEKTRSSIGNRRSSASTSPSTRASGATYREIRV